MWEISWNNWNSFELAILLFDFGWFIYCRQKKDLFNFGDSFELDQWNNKEWDSDEIGDVQGELDQLENSAKENEEIQAEDILYWTAGRKDNENSKIHVQTNENKKM